MQQSHQCPFQQWFWSPTSSIDAAPNFSHGLNVLHQKLSQSNQENRAIVEFIKERINTEQQYAQRLAELGHGSPAMSVFDKDIGGSLKKCFEVLCSESTELGQGHHVRANNLQATALDPLIRLCSRYERIIEQTRDITTKTVARLDALTRDALTAHANYIAKCKLVQNLQMDMPPEKCCAFWLSLKLAVQGVPHIAGHTLVDWIRTRPHRPPAEDPADMAQALIAQGWVECVEDTDTSSPDNTYRLCLWSKGDTKRLVDTSSFWNRWSHKPDFEHEILVNELVEADKKYFDTVQIAEQLRMETEEALFMHYEEMESLELDRIQTIKQAFISVAAALSNTIPLCQEVYDRVMLYQETLRPEKDIQLIVEQYRTGRFLPRPMIYRSPLFGVSAGQVFGVPLDDVCQNEQTPIPNLISMGLSIISSRLEQLRDQGGNDALEEAKVWTTHLPLDRLHAARQEISSMALFQPILEKYDILLLTSLVRLYLLELPDCLLTYELYETAKVLYSGDDPDEHRITSVGKLLSTLPSSHFYTLQALAAHFYQLASRLDPDQQGTFIRNISDTLGPILLRPHVETTLTMHHRHPQRLFKDVVEQYNGVFCESTCQAQENHANRKPVVAPKTPSLEAPSIQSSLSSSPPSPASWQTPLVASTAGVDATMSLGQSIPHNSSGVQRRSSLLSFIRRPSSRTEFSEPESPLGIRTKRPPIPMPSSSTLFEEPDESPISPSYIPRTRHSTDGTGSLDAFFHDDDEDHPLDIDC